MAKGITILEGQDLKIFYNRLGVEVPEDAYRVRIWAQGDGTVKVKVNEGMWTWGFGKADEA